MAFDVKTAKKITLGGVEVKQIKNSSGVILWNGVVDATSSDYWDGGGKSSEWTQEWVDAIQTLSDAQLASLVGKERYVVVNSQKHIVRVIGYNHDELADGSGKAKLTFEFANLYTETSGTNKQVYWNSSNNNTKYSAATISTDTTGSGSSYGLPYIKTKLPSKLQSVLKKVSKPTGDQSTTSSSSTKITRLETTTPAQDLFLLSAREIGFGDNSTYKGRGYDSLQEGSEYAYYASSTATRVKCSVGSSSANYYWLRSPYGYNDLIYRYIAFGVTSDGSLSYNVVNNTGGVAPAFCI